MGMKFNLDRLDAKDVNSAIEESKAGGRYTGPTPPDDFYHVKVKKLWASQTKKGDDCFKALLVIDETGDKKTYNGAGIFYTLMFPKSRTDDSFAPRVSEMERFFRELSRGKVGFMDIYNAAVDGKVIVDKSEKSGEPVKSIGKFKFVAGEDLEIKTKNSPNSTGGDPYVNVHYVLDTERSKGEVDEDPEVVEDDDVEGLDESEAEAEVEEKPKRKTRRKKAEPEPEPEDEDEDDDELDLDEDEDDEDDDDDLDELLG